MIEMASNIFFTILGVFFFMGCLFILPPFKKSRDPQNFFNLVLLVIFVTPFVFYLVVGTLGFKLGNPRNFFYLLPIYLLVIFNGFRKLIYNRKIFYSLSIIILIFLLFNGIMSSYTFWKRVYIERAIMRQATKIDVGFVVISYTQRTSWPFKYYAQKYGFSHKSCPWDSIKDREGSFSFFEEVKNISKFAIIGDQTLHLKDKYFLGEKLFKINKTISHGANYGPFWFLQKFLDRPSTTISIHLFNES